MFRSIRALKLLYKWPSLRDYLAKLKSSSSNIINFSILLVLIIFIYALIGMELFENDIKFNEDDHVDSLHGKSPRFNFDNLGHALISVFILLIR